MRKHNLWLDVAKGVVAGAVATMVMSRATTLLYKGLDGEALAREKAAEKGGPAVKVAARKLADIAGAELSGEQEGRAANAVHWAVGLGAGALYGALRPRVKWADQAQGLGFGTAFWLVADEMLVPLLKLSSGPTKYPWQTHARGLAGHLTYGLVADTTLDLLDRVVH
jgi:hypothetical protein